MQNQTSLQKNQIFIDANVKLNRYIGHFRDFLRTGKKDENFNVSEYMQVYNAIHQTQNLSAGDNSWTEVYEN